MANDEQKDTLTETVEVEQIGQCKRRIKVSVPSQEVQKQFDVTYQEVKKVAQIPGFRPGKAPRHVLEMRMGKTFRDEALSEIRRRMVGRAVREHKLHPVGPPQYENVNYQQGQPFSFEATLEVLPEMTLPEYKGIKIQRTVAPETTGQDVMTELNRIRRDFGEFVLVEDRPLRDGDFAVISYQEEADGKTENFEKRVIEIDPDNPLPGFGEKVRGMRPGETREFQIRIPEDYSEKEAAGKSVNYRVELKEIKTLVLPELDDNLAKKAHLGSLDELKRALHRTITEDREKRAEEAEISQLMTYLLKNTEFEVPPSLLAEGTRERARRKISVAFRSGLSREQVQEKTKEIIEDAAGETYGSLKLEIIFSRIAETEGITVSDEELEARIESIAAREKLNNEEVKKRFTDQNLRDALREGILEKKVISFLHNSAVKE